MLIVRFQDLFRATLPGTSGNEGWIGVSPRGDEYHVVVPVDVQIARGVMACNRPTDGMPFGGYSQWIYFRCEPFEGDDADTGSVRTAKARANAAGLLRFLASYGIAAGIEETPTIGDLPPS